MNIVSSVTRAGRSPVNTSSAYSGQQGNTQFTIIRVRSVIKLIVRRQKMVSSQCPENNGSSSRQPAVTGPSLADTPHKCGKFPPFS